MQVYLIACAKSRAQAPKPAGIISVQRRTHGTRGRKVRLSRKQGVSPPFLSLSVCLFQRLCHLLSPAFFSVFGPWLLFSDDSYLLGLSLELLCLQPLKSEQLHGLKSSLSALDLFVPIAV